MERRRFRSSLTFAALALIFLGAIAAGWAVLEVRRLAEVVDEKFAGRRWDFPSRIFSDEFLIHVGLDVEASQLRRRLERLAYRPVAGPPRAGGDYRWGEDAIEVALRPGARGRVDVERVRIGLEGGLVTGIHELEGGAALGAVSLEPEEITGIYDGDWEQRRAIRVVDVSPILVRAILATEDTRFFSHHGVDLVGVGRAALANLRSGRVRQGGSTLTQQLMKNFFLTNERTMSRKVREIAMALVAERRYSKMQILENYLNEIYLGQRGARGVFGVAEASRFYFGKDPRELSLAEAALLAGLIRAPNAYSPYLAPDRALERRNTVLRLLLEAGEIDETGYREAIASPLGIAGSVAQVADAPYFVDYVKAELAGRFPEQVLTTEGLLIYTTLDPLLQEEANHAVERGLERLERENPRLRRKGRDDRLETALVALRPHSGEIRAMVGGRDYHSSQFNRATQARRQPGSAFKPVVFLAGLLASGEGHVTPATLLDDSPFIWTYDGGREWSPSNDGGRYHGTVTVRTALENSLNAATAQVARGVGLPAIVEVAHSLGWSGPLPEVPSLVLGSAEVTPLEITSIYAVLASGGTRADPVAIRRVESRTGELIAGEAPALRAAVPPADAFVLTHLLEGVLERGTGRSARASGFHRPAAGKTGTTNDTRDAWFVGYTPDLVAGVWVGFDQGASVGLSGSRAALPIWTDFMKQATASDPPRDFLPPPGVTLMAIDRASGQPVDTGAGSLHDGEDVIEEAFLEPDAPAARSGTGEGGAAGMAERVPSQEAEVALRATVRDESD